MKNNSQQTAEKDLPPVPVFSFVKGAQSKELPIDPSPELADATVTNNDNIPQPKKPAKKKPRSKPAAKPAPVATDSNISAEIVAAYSEPKYHDLCSKARRSIQDRLASLKFIRTRTNHQTSTIKQFIEEALAAWLDSPASKLAPRTKVATPELADVDEPFLTFNNVIRESYRKQIDQICFDRKKVNHPVRTIIAILDEAFTIWLPQQKDLFAYEESQAKQQVTNELMDDAKQGLS